jgi:hypothetical protein
MALKIKFENELEKEIRDKIKTFCLNYKDTHSTNVQDFKVSKNIASGNGFEIYNKGTVWNKDRARVSVNLLEPIVNSVVYKFTENPFNFIVQGQEQANSSIDFKELKFQLGLALRDACIDGMSYILTYKKDEQIRFNRLNNFNVIFGDCEYSNGKDVKEVIYVDKKSTGKKQKTKTEMSVTFDTVLNLKEDEIPVITYWFIGEDGRVNTVKLENDEIVSHVIQEIEKIPVTRIYAKEVPIDYKRNWRGLYYLVKDLLRTIDLQMSLVQERIATAPNNQFWIAEESLGNNIEQLSRLNDIPTAFKTYKATNPNAPGVTLPPPQRNDLATNINDLIQAFDIHKTTISQILGTIAGEEKGNETAEAVLLRRENKDTAVNDLIKNLLDSSYLIAELIEEFTGFKITVQSDIFEKAKQNEELQKIIALTQFISQNKTAYAVTPVLISKLDVDQKTKEMLMALLSQEKEQMDGSNQEIEFLKMENQQLKSDKEAQVVAAQIMRETQIATKTIDAQIKEEEFKLKWAELGMKQEGDQIKLAQESEKIKNDLETKIADLQIKGFNAGVDSVG